MRRVLLIGCIPLLLALGACDATPGSDSLDRRPPEVSNLLFAPDTVDVNELPPDRVSDSLATVAFAVEATVRDPDGTVDRVVFTVEPSTNPQETAQGELQVLDGNRYGAAGELQLDARRDEIYTFRVFAVDDDQQVGNQAVAQLRLIAASED